MPRTATADRVDRAELLASLRPRHRTVLMTRRGAGRHWGFPASAADKA